VRGLVVFTPTGLADITGAFDELYFAEQMGRIVAQQKYFVSTHRVNDCTYDEGLLIFAPIKSTETMIVAMIEDTFFASTSKRCVVELHVISF